MMEDDQKLGLYEVYGDTKEDLVENNSPIEEETPIIVENTLEEEQPSPILQWEEYMHPDFPWSNRKLWINNPKAVNFWLSTKGGTVRDLSRIRNEEENVKTY
jgi:hypothetical protein